MRAPKKEDLTVFPKSVLRKLVATLFPLAVAAGVQAQELSDEQRAEIEARLAPVGSVCVQGENCGGLPKMTKPAKPAPQSKPTVASNEAAKDAADDAEQGAEASGADAESAVDAAAEAVADASAAAEDVVDDLEQAAEEAGAAVSAAVTDAATVAAAPAIDGEAIYNQACMACHMSGVGGAPKVGNIDDWSPRIAKGIDALHNSGLNGVAGTAMMAKGGRMDLSDQQIMAAVDYMVESSQ
jgi:cytochrome c5